MLSLSDSTSSESENQDNVTLSSVSLRDEMQRINDLLSSIKKNCPEKKSTRIAAKKNILTSPQSDQIPKIVEYLDAIFALNMKIVDEIDALNTENKELRQYMERPSPVTSYAAVAGAGALSVGSSSSVHDLSGGQVTAVPSARQQVPSVELKDINLRIDSLEQESLNSILVLRGPAIDKLVEPVDGEPAAGEQAHGEPRIIPAPSNIKEKTYHLLRSTVADLSKEEISTVIIQGKNSKHLKVTCTTQNSKVFLLSTLKRLKPQGIFANEYLTKQRSLLLYKLRCLKKRFPQVRSVYSRSGVVCYRLSDNNKPTVVNGIGEISELEVILSNK